MNFCLHKVIISLVGGTFLSLKITMKRVFDKAKVSVLAATVKLAGFSTRSSQAPAFDRGNNINKEEYILL